MPWIVDFLAGLSLALLLYWLVRFRMVAAPAMRDRFGAWARWSIWVLVAALMVLVANLELIGLRRILHDQFNIDSLLVHEIIFAMVTLIGGYLLVSRYVMRRKRKGEDSGGNGSDCGIKK